MDCGCLQFSSEQASQREENTSWRREGWDTRPCTTLMEDEGWTGGGVQQRSKLEVHTERRGPRVEWKMEEERGERREDEGERKAGWRGQGESVRERERRVGVVASPLDCY